MSPFPEAIPAASLRPGHALSDDCLRSPWDPWGTSKDMDGEKEPRKVRARESEGARIAMSTDDGDIRFSLDPGSVNQPTTFIVVEQVRTQAEQKLRNLWKHKS